MIFRFNNLTPSDSRPQTPSNSPQTPSNSPCLGGGLCCRQRWLAGGHNPREEGSLPLPPPKEGVLCCCKV